LFFVRIHYYYHRDDDWNQQNLFRFLLAFSIQFMLSFLLFLNEINNEKKTHLKVGQGSHQIIQLLRSSRCIVSYHSCFSCFSQIKVKSMVNNFIKICLIWEKKYLQSVGCPETRSVVVSFTVIVTCRPDFGF
jgi:hypothetical protein